jgi:uncharacterized membrane protein
MVGLGDLLISSASGVSADGSVVVGGGLFTGVEGEAFRWTASSGMQRLWDLLLAQGVDPAADGWTVLSDATSISADGNTIVGYGTHNGNTEAFVATVPDPTTAVLFGISLICIAAASCGRVRQSVITAKNLA